MWFLSAAVLRPYTDAHIHIIGVARIRQRTHATISTQPLATKSMSGAAASCDRSGQQQQQSRISFREEKMRSLAFNSIAYLYLSSSHSFVNCPNSALALPLDTTPTDKPDIFLGVVCCSLHIAIRGVVQSVQWYSWSHALYTVHSFTSNYCCRQQVLLLITVVPSKEPIHILNVQCH